MYSDDLEYAANRLEGTIVMLEGEPVYVNTIGLDGLTDITWLKDRSEDECYIDDLDLVGQNKLGYVNLHSTAVYVGRMPLRNDWRQGIRIANLSFSGNKGFDRIPWPEFRKTILGEYPSFTEAKELICSGQSKVAFSRHFALMQGGVILYKERTVGNYDIVTNLMQQFTYLNEHLQAMIEGSYENN